MDKKISNKKISKQQFDILAVPCNRTFVVSNEKSQEFKNKKTDLKIAEMINEKANLFEEKCLNNKVKKLSKKRDNL